GELLARSADQRVGEGFCSGRWLQRATGGGAYRGAAKATAAPRYNHASRARLSALRQADGLAHRAQRRAGGFTVLGMLRLPGVQGNASAGSIRRIRPIKAGVSVMLRRAVGCFASVVLALMCHLEVRGVEEPPIDHAGIIRSWDAESLARGEKLYNSICVTCHGNLTQAGSLPTSRPFWKEPFKNGSDPLSLYKTLSQGLGQMPAWTFLTPEQRYDAIHYIRETFVRPHNPGAYCKITEQYLPALPTGTTQTTPEILAFEKGPQYLRMDFGPVLFWTLQVETNNIAYKGIAVRLDDGPGGVSKGRAWMLYDH